MTLPAAPLRDDLAAALRTTWPVLLGYLPLGAAFGVLLVAAGFPWWWAPIWCSGASFFRFPPAWP